MAPSPPILLHVSANRGLNAKNSLCEPYSLSKDSNFSRFKDQIDSIWGLQLLQKQSGQKLINHPKSSSNMCVCVCERKGSPLCVNRSHLQRVGLRYLSSEQLDTEMKLQSYRQIWNRNLLLLLPLDMCTTLEGFQVRILGAFPMVEYQKDSLNLKNGTD